MSFPLHKKLMVNDSLEWGSMKEKIIEGAIEVYKKKGPKFTMDDLATSLGMSKKTIYTVFHDKKSLLIDMVDYTFDAIKRAEEEVMKKPGLSTEERLRDILGVMPDQMMGVDFNQMYTLKEKYPEAYAMIAKRLENGWELTLSVLNQGIEEGVFRPIDNAVFQMIFEASLERFLNGDELAKNHIKYLDALNQLVDVLIDGIKVKDNN